MIFETVYIHQPEDKYWVSVGLNPKNFPLLELEVNNQSKYFYMDLKISERIDIFMDQPNAPCRNYVEGPAGFSKCCQNFTSKILNSKLNCSIPGKSDFVL